MILDLDIGNTRCKWRISDGGGGIMADGVAALEELQGAVFSTSEITRVRVASVRGPEVARMVSRWAQSELGVEAEFASSVLALAGVTNGYLDPARLGVDRWLAMLAGYSEVRGAVCVVDCGSAITADLVDGRGSHRGGYITPGIQIMRHSLLSRTDGVRFDPDMKLDDADPGLDTQRAVCNGTLMAAAGFINRTYDRFSLIVPGSTLLLTGGDAAALQSLVSPAAAVRPALVLDGLGLALP